MNLRAGNFVLELGHPLVMGIVNVTPDSFSDGGKFITCDAAIEHARQLVRDGADMVDIGGESTRPGATAATLEEELGRVMPVLEAIVNDGIPVSIDTPKDSGDGGSDQGRRVDDQRHQCAADTGRCQVVRGIERGGLPDA